MRANVVAGVRHADCALIREAIALWWTDVPASGLGSGYSGRTRRVTASAEPINSMDLGVVRPGDCAVTADGTHVMAYLGDGRWISADPDAGRVLIKSAPDPNYGWFTMPVHIVRWAQFG
jgi:hypothetical protein